jgi:hypothetical protein
MVECRDTVGYASQTTVTVTVPRGKTLHLWFHSPKAIRLWSDERAARAFMNERVAPMIREKFHVDPTIEFYDSPVIVEN